jgi:tetratricopeptide (TPR) repeat protein/2-polyprenyl-3-methyl-5-hydroxy-6-metoxy-1,4-benzoquinol methylase
MSFSVILPDPDRDALAREAMRRLDAGQQAIPLARTLAALDPGDSEAWRICAAAGLSDDALAADRAARRALTIRPTNRQALRLKALSALKRGYVATAEHACRAANAGETPYADGVALRALIAMTKGDTATADVDFRRASILDPAGAEVAGNHAALAARRGDAASAERLAARALRLKPFLVGPRLLLGSLLYEKGLLPEAADVLREAVRRNPADPVAVVNLTTALLGLNEKDEAVRICRDAVRRRPDDAALWTNLGAALGIGDAGEAALRRALALRPDHAEAANNLGELAFAAGNRQRAAALLRAAAHLRPGDPAISRRAAAALLDAGDLKEAGRMAALIAQNVGDADSLVLLGRVLTQSGKTEQAEAIFREAARRVPSDPEPLRRAVAAFLKEGDLQRAAPFARTLIRRAPQCAGSWTAFSRISPAVAHDDPALRDELLRAYGETGADLELLAAAAARIFAATPAAIRLIAAATAHDPQNAAQAALAEGALDELAADELTAAMLDGAVVADARSETVLTLARGALAARVAAETEISPTRRDWTPFAAALARQCLLNEYVFDESPAETADVERIAGLLSADAAAGFPSAEAPLRLAIYAAYRPLIRAPFVDQLPSRPWPATITRLIERQVVRPREEAALRSTIPRLTEIDDPTSVRVRAQYEENPYPRWLRAPLLDAPAPMATVFRALLPHAGRIESAGPGVDILVAGCGTGREAVWAANHFAGARVLAVDVSLASLAYAMRQTRAAGVAGVDYAQADVTAPERLGRSFDIIQAVGVLHHTADVLQSWRRLTTLLRPNGVMKLGLYSRIARRPVAAAREAAADILLPPGLEGVRAIRRAARAAPPDHPARIVMRSPDFYSASACRDLLLHVHEVCVDLKEIAGWIDELDLEFLGFNFADDQATAAYRRRYPQDSAMLRLDLWNAFEEEHPETFSGMYQFWVRRRRR